MTVLEELLPVAHAYEASASFQERRLGNDALVRNGWGVPSADSETPVKQMELDFT